MPRLAHYALSLALLLTPVTPAAAFDTGHHWDATLMGMTAADSGFSNTAKEVAATANWLVDYYSESPLTTPLADQDDFANLHFDNLFDEDQVEATWNTLMQNYDAQLRRLVSSSEPRLIKLLGTYALMGMTMHAVQDFYTHSTWADFHPKSNGAYSTATVLGGDLDETVATSLSDPNRTLQTGYYPSYYINSPPPGSLAHGTYTSGINKDSHMRPHWDEAFVFAYIETYRLTLMTIETIADEDSDFLDDFLDFGASDIMELPGELTAIAGDAAAAYDVSMFIYSEDDGADGHYKGEYSGNSANLAETTAAWYATDYSELQAAVIGLVANGTLVHCLYNFSPACTAPALSGSMTVYDTPDVNVLSVRIDDVTYLGGGTDPFGNDPDYFAQFEFPGISMKDRVLDNRKNYSADQHIVQGQEASAYWGMYFVDDSAATVNFRIRLYDYDAESGNDTIDISDDGDNIDLTYQFSDSALGGDVDTGVYDTRASAVTSKGGHGSNTAQVTYFVYHETLR